MADPTLSDRIHRAIAGYEEGAWVPERAATIEHVGLLAEAKDALRILEQFDRLTAGSVANFIDANRVPSPWRDGGFRLKAFGGWLRSLASNRKETTDV